MTDLKSKEIDDLVKLLEEVTRASEESVKRFIEPARGTLDRAKSSRHHITFGRRGSGKSSLLRKVAGDLTIERKPVAYVDLETFKGHAYPDVLLSILIETLNSFEKWLESSGSYTVNKVKYWISAFGRRPTAPPVPKRKRSLVVVELQAVRLELERLLQAQDQATVESSKSFSTKSLEEERMSVGVRSSVLDLGGSSKSTVDLQHAHAVKEVNQRSKIDFLHRHILRFQRLFKEIAGLGGGRAYLILDDLYHIRREDQANVIDYFHRIAKNSGVWIKVGTIRHRTEHYRHGNPPIGMKLGDDADEVDLDLTLEKYELAKDFLKKVLNGLLSEVRIRNWDDILSETAIDRLVLASGGVARDFLTILRRGIDFARERGNDARGPRIAAEDINRASGEHDGTKRQELLRDSAEDSAKIEHAFAAVREFCLNKTHANCS